MSREREIFGISGPFYLTNIDWTNPFHRRSTAASLVKGVYILERDRQQNRQGRQALALPWWDSFGFRLNQILVDDDDRSYFGAIYEYMYYNNNHHHPNHQRPPRYVIAFRGTIMEPDTWVQDLKLDLQFIRNCLNRCSRFQHGLQIAESVAVSAGPGNVWLAGHSLGSAISLLVGRNMVIKNGLYVESYLFNPPFASPPLEMMIKNEKIKHGIRIAKSMITAALAHGSEDSKSRDMFIALSEWVPYLFVSPSDPICCEYVAYFEHRDKMVAIGAGGAGRVATQNSMLSLLTSGKDSEPVHLIPSAYVTINLSRCEGFKQAHGLEQWWRPEIYCDYKLYKFK